LLGATVELGDRDDRDVELLGEQLDLPGELRDLDLRDSTFLPLVISWR